MRDVLPAKVKIIISLRNPVDWAWSFARMNMRDGFIASDSDSLEEYFDVKISRCSFSASLKRWHRYFPQEQILTVFFDELRSSPETYLGKICGFLGVDADRLEHQDLRKKRNQGAAIPVPDKLRERIRRGWADDLAELAEILPDLPKEWLSER
jgi:hypothetical protein